MYTVLLPVKGGGQAFEAACVLFCMCKHVQQLINVGLMQGYVYVVLVKVLSC